MPNVYLVTYDLKKPVQDYAKLYEILKGFGPWWHYLESTWLIVSSDEIGSFSAKIRAAIDTNDHLLVAKIIKPCDGWLPKDAWTWINTNVP